MVSQSPADAILAETDPRSIRLPQGAGRAALVFLLARVGLFALAALLARVVAPDRALQHAGLVVPSGLGGPLGLWARWDSVWLVRIAEHGYAHPPGAAAFQPLYPGLLAVVGRLAGGHYVLAGVTLSLLFAVAAAALLYRLGADLLGEAAARRSVLYLALFPLTFFLGAVYSESLYLLLALAAFVLAERGRFGAAGAAAGLAILTRAVGVVLLPALVLLALRSHSPRRALAGVALSLPLAALTPLGVLAAGRSPFDLFRAQALWQRQLSATAPLDGVHKAWQAAHGAYLVWPSELANLLFLVLFVALTVVAWRRLGAPYGLFAALSLVVPLSVPSAASPLLSLPRFGLVVFPFFLALATLGERRRAHVAIVTLSLAGLVLALTAWTSWHWVA